MRYARSVGSKSGGHVRVASASIQFCTHTGVGGGVGSIFNAVANSTDGTARPLATTAVRNKTWLAHSPSGLNMALSATSTLAIFESIGLWQRIIKLAKTDDVEIKREMISLLCLLSCHTPLAKVLVESRTDFDAAISVLRKVRNRKRSPF